MALKLGYMLKIAGELFLKKNPNVLNIYIRISRAGTQASVVLKTSQMRPVYSQAVPVLMSMTDE